jgi:hypothetical protein
MFYLEQILKFIRKNLFIGTMFILTSILFLTVFVNQKTFDQTILKNAPLVGVNDYFYSLLDKKENPNRIARRIRKLPGVAKVEIIQNKQIKSEALRVLDELKETKLANEFESSQIGLKIEVKKGISKRSVELMRDYLLRLVGEDKITVGAVVSQSSKENLYLSWKDNIMAKARGISLVLLALVWVVLWTVVKKNLLKWSYILQEFQRRDKVELKLVSTLLAISILLGVIVSYIIGPQDYRNLFTVIGFAFLLTLFSSRKLKWKS